MKQETVKETLGRVQYLGRDIKNSAANALSAINDLGSAYAETRDSAGRALPLAVAAVIRDAKALAAALPELRAFVAGAPDVPPAELPEIIDGGWSIQTRFVSPTNTRGARIKVWRVDTLSGKTETLFCPFDHGARCPHEVAARAWFAKFGHSLKCGPFRLFKGSTKLGFVFTLCFN